MEHCEILCTRHQQSVCRREICLVRKGKGNISHDLGLPVQRPLKSWYEIHGKSAGIPHHFRVHLNKKKVSYAEIGPEDLRQYPT